MVASVEKITVLADWIAVIYTPSRETKDLNNWAELTGGINVQRLPIARYLQIPLVVPKDHKPGEALETRSLFLRPGTNLNSKDERILLSDWQAICEADDRKGKTGGIRSIAIAIEKGVYEICTPDMWDGIGEPGYRHFSPKLATQLVLATTHEDWLDGWMQGETRAEIIKVAAEHRERIIAAKKRNAA